jgi:hypothetical protein
MAIPVNNYQEFGDLVEQLWNQTPLFGFVLHDGRRSHQDVAQFLKISAAWLDELAIQSGIYILFPLKTDKNKFVNPSPMIAKEFKLTSNRLPGIVLFTTSDTKGYLRSKHFIFIPLADTEFVDVENMQATIADVFSVVQETLDEGYVGHDALKSIRTKLSEQRKQRKKNGLIQALRSGAQIVLKQFPEKFITSFAESFGKALGDNLAKPNE